MDKRYRIARAIAEVDTMGPEIFDDAVPSEQRMYDFMGLAALDAAHIYAVHTLDCPETFQAIGSVTGAMTITRDRDPYADWGEPHRPGEAEHLMVGVSDDGTALALVRALDALGVPSDVTDHKDWAEEPGDLPVLDERYSWSDWIDQQ